MKIGVGVRNLLIVISYLCFFVFCRYGRLTAPTSSSLPPTVLSRRFVRVKEFGERVIYRVLLLVQICNTHG